VPDADPGASVDAPVLLVSLSHAGAARPRKGEPVKAQLGLVAVLAVACGGEFFEASSARVGHDSGAPEIGAPADAGCQNRYIALPGAAGSFVSFGGPDIPGPLTVEMTVRLAAGGRMGLARASPEAPCGWHVFVSASHVQATVTASFDHEANVQIAGNGWQRIRWELSAEWSVLSVDGLEIGRIVPNGFPKSCSGKTLLGVFAIGAGAPYDWSVGDVDSLGVGASSWNFDEPSGALLDSAGRFPGELVGNVNRECK
jgi:hypothetical protein